MSRIVILGATGNVGGAALTALARSAARDTVVAVSRRDRSTPDGAAASWITADAGDPASLAAVLRPGDRLLLHGFGPTDDIVDALARRDVDHVVLLSSQGAGTRPDLYLGAHALERAVRSCGLPHTVLRPSGFMTNTLAWAPSVRDGGPVQAPFADVALPIVDPVDVGRVAAGILFDPSTHLGAIHTLTGPAAVSPREQADILGASLGRGIPFVELSRAQARAAMIQQMPPDIADATLAVLGDPLPDERATTGTVELLLGRPPATYADWTRVHRAAFEPDPSGQPSSRSRGSTLSA